jgi:hypothetical protein
LLLGQFIAHLIGKSRAVNHRLPMIERAGPGCAIGDDLFDHSSTPPPASQHPSSSALATIDRTISTYIDHVRLRIAA